MMWRAYCGATIVTTACWRLRQRHSTGVASHPYGHPGLEHITATLLQGTIPDSYGNLTAMETLLLDTRPDVTGLSGTQLRRTPC